MNYRYGRPQPEPNGFYGSNHDDWVLSERHSEPERLTSDQLFTMYLNAWQRYVAYRELSVDPLISISRYEPIDPLYTRAVLYLCIAERLISFYVKRLKEGR